MSRFTKCDSQFSDELLMPTPIVFDAKTRFHIEYNNQRLNAITKPFMKAVSRELAKSGDLESSVLRAADILPDAAQNFVIEPGNILRSFGLRSESLFQEMVPCVTEH